MLLINFLIREDIDCCDLLHFFLKNIFQVGVVVYFSLKSTVVKSVL